MAERPRFFDDLAGVAGGAFSALAGMREEVESTVRARVDEAIRKFDLVKREDLEAVQEMASLARESASLARESASLARAGQLAAEERLAALESKVASLVLHSAVSTRAVAPPAGTPFEPPSLG